MRKEKDNKNIYPITKTKLSSKNGFVSLKTHPSSTQAALSCTTQLPLFSHMIVLSCDWQACEGRIFQKTFFRDVIQTLLDIEHTGRDPMMPVSQLVVLRPDHLGVHFGHPDDPAIERQNKQQIERINVSILLRKTQNNALQQTLIQFKLNTEWITLCVWFLNVSKTQPIFNVMRLIFSFCLSHFYKKTICIQFLNQKYGKLFLLLLKPFAILTMYDYAVSCILLAASDVVVPRYPFTRPTSHEFRFKHFKHTLFPQTAPRHMFSTIFQ